MTHKNSDTIPASDPPAKAAAPSPDLTLSPLSKPTPTQKRKPVTYKDGVITRIDY